MTEIAGAFAKLMAITFSVLFALCWTPLSLLPAFIAAAFTSLTGAMFFLLVVGAPFGGFTLLLATSIWREDFAGFWKELAGLAGAWAGVIFGAMVGTRISGGL